MAKDEEHAELNAVGLITDVKTNADKGAAAEAQNTDGDPMLLRTGCISCAVRSWALYGRALKHFWNL